MKRLCFAILLLTAHSVRVSATNIHLGVIRSNDGIGTASPSPISVDTPRRDNFYVDSLFKEWSNDTLSDSLDVFLGSDGTGIQHRRHRPHIYVLSEPEHGRQVPYREKFSMIDFNRATGLFLGLGSPGFTDLGPHDEIGTTGGLGYGFADKRWEFRLGAELRLPLVNMRKLEYDTTMRNNIYTPHTLAIGGEVHNITATDDAWRAGRLENALDAFFAREDFRDYYKLAGWDAYVAYRPNQNSEARLDWRSDHYQSLSQEVFYGRFGGNKELPPNPPVAEGTMNSMVLTLRHEGVHTRRIEAPNAFGDFVWLEQLRGSSILGQIELGHMPGSDFGFNRYVLDWRRFSPLVRGISLDARLRYEATTGDLLPQKLEYLGGPSSLPALYRKGLVGNRMLLLNTELRLNLRMLSKVLGDPDMCVVVYNDFAKLGIAADGESIVNGFGFSGLSSILYNVGVGLGGTNGPQIGVTWPTNVKDDPRWIFRLQRAF